MNFGDAQKFKKGMIQMKKVLALVICIAMIACVALTASADATKATFNIDVVDGKVGETVVVNMDIEEAKTMIGAIGFKFVYDTTYLKLVENPTTYNYFSTGLGAGGATAAGNENTMEVQLATADGFKAPGTVIALAFEVIKDIPTDAVARVDAKIIVEPKAATDEIEGYDIVINAGGVAGPKSAPTEDVPSVVPSEPTSQGTTPPPATGSDTQNPPTGDATGIAVAAGLCAVMAAAFVITKKVND